MHTLILHVINIHFNIISPYNYVVHTWLRRLVGGLSPLRPWFSPGLVHVRFVVDQVAPGEVFL